MNKAYSFVFFMVCCQQSQYVFGQNGGVPPLPTTPKPTRSGIEDVRLESGTSWRGRLAIKQKGKWGSICKYDLNDNIAVVACRQMEITSKLKPILYYRPLTANYSYPVLVDRVVCQGSEEKLADCDYIDYNGRYRYCSQYTVVGVDCGAPEFSESDITIQLNSQYLAFNQSTAYSENRGHLEIFLGPSKKLGYVCQTGFDINAAKVVCRMLGLPTSKAKPGYYSPFGWANSGTEHWINSIACNGNEEHILSCRLSNSWGRESCPNNQIVAVDCNGTDAFSVSELTIGTSPQNGIVRVLYHNKTAKQLCLKGFTDDIAATVCKNLGFVKAGVRPRIYSGDMFIRHRGNPWLENYNCPENAKSFTDCTFPYFGSSKKTCPAVAGLDCTGSLYFTGYRLVGGYDNRSGRLELQRHGQWRSICTQAFRAMEGRIVCTALGFSNVTSMPTIVRNKFGVGDSSKRWRDNFACDPSHTFKNLFDCSRNIYETRCDDIDDVGVTCYEGEMVPIFGLVSVSSPKGRDLEVKLIGGYSNSSGHVEIFYDQKWNFICNDMFDDNAAKVICKMAGFDTEYAAVIRTTRYGNGENAFLLDDVMCDGSETSIMDCEHRQIGVSDCSSIEAVAVDCFGHTKDLPIRQNEGRVEVQHHSVWGSICSDMVEKEEATVICRQLGLGTTNVTWTTMPNKVDMDGPIWLDDIKCTGDESKIGDCKRSPLGEHNCAHKDDLFVACG